MQSNDPSSRWKKVGPPHPCAEAESAPGLQSPAKRSCAGSNGRSGRVAGTKAEAHIFQRLHEAGTGRLAGRRIRGNGILREKASKKGDSRDSRHTSWELFYRRLRCLVAGEGRVFLSYIFEEDACTCKAALRRVKVRRRTTVICYCESAMKSLPTTRTS